MKSLISNFLQKNGFAGGLGRLIRGVIATAERRKGISPF
jgi:hypothetical protein